MVPSYERSFDKIQRMKEVIVKTIFPICISIFGSPQKFLLDNEGEFNNHEFISLCENVLFVRRLQKLHGAMVL